MNISLSIVGKDFFEILVFKLPLCVVKIFIYQYGFCKIAFSFVNWTVCPNGKFGLNCENDCHCLNSMACDKENGHCSSGCAPGWKGNFCEESMANYFIPYTGDKSFVKWIR